MLIFAVGKLENMRLRPEAFSFSCSGEDSQDRDKNQHQGGENFHRFPPYA